MVVLILSKDTFSTWQAQLILVDLKIEELEIFRKDPRTLAVAEAGMGIGVHAGLCCKYVNHCSEHAGRFCGAES